MKATTTSAKISPQSDDAAPGSRWPRIIPTPAVWESGAMAIDRRDVADALYRPRKMDLTPHCQQPLW